MQPTTPNPLMNLVPIAAIFAIFYFLLIRPQQKQQKDHDSMLKGLKTGDKILTTGGLYGTITRLLGENDLEVQFSQTVKLTVNRTAVSRVVSAEAPVKTGTIV
ncbi:MAG TPA: preprotein translocase subunit YajC [Elusimicrobiota bacterium]|jgi:preprotein translocase subunit YajC|nr:preprotein translocase subunit YajC [Elusimicrobiota bacterium]